MKKSDDSGEQTDVEFSDEPTTPKQEEYIHDTVPSIPLEMLHETASISEIPGTTMDEVITAREMAQLTFQGEQEFRSKVNVEIVHNLDKELARVVKLCRSAGVEGSSWFTYDHNEWSDWINKGPELSKGTKEGLARRKTRMRENMILESLKKRLEWEGYTCDITRPYRGLEDDKYFLYVQWSQPKPALSREGCWRNLKACIRLTILISIVMWFLAMFTILLIFTGWLLYTRWEKLDLL